MASAHPTPPRADVPRAAYERAALQAASLDAGFERVCRLAAVALDAESGLLWTRYGDVARRSRHGTAGWPPGPHLSDAIARGVVETELPRTVRVDADSPGLAGHPRDFASAFFVPVRAGGHVVGCLAALSSAAREWSGTQQAILTDLAEVAGQSVEEWVHADRREAGWLRERASELSIMFQSARMGTFDWNVASDSVVVSGHFDEYLSARRGGYAGGYRDWLQGVHPDDRDRIDRSLQHALASGLPFRARYRLLQSDDGWGVRWVETFAHVLANDRSVPERVLGVCFDLSEQAQATSAGDGTTGILHRFNVIDTIRDAVVLSEAEPREAPGGPRVVAVNEAFTRMTGFAAADIVGQSPRILQGPDTEAAVRARIRDALAAWQPLRCRITNYRKSGEPFRVELDIVPVADPSGWYTHWVSVQREVFGPD